MSTLTIEASDVEWRNIITDAMMGVTSIITKAGEPIAEVKPVSRKQIQPMFGCARGKIKMAADFNQPLEDFQDYM